MARLFLYLGMMAVGALIGSRKFMITRSFSGIAKIQAVVLVFLIFILGANVGADDRVFDGLAEIGVSAGVITLFAVVGSLVCVTILRRMLGMGKDGRKKTSPNEEEPG